MMIKLEMENIGGLRGHYEFSLDLGLNILEAPNATGKTSIINGIRILILPSNHLKNLRHFLNLMVKDGKISAKTEQNLYLREIHETGGNLFVSGNTLFEVDEKADVLAVAHRENELLNLVVQGKSLKPVLDKFSDSKYYRSASQILNWKQKATLNELKNYRDEQRRLDEYRKQLTDLQKKKQGLIYEQKQMEEIPSASAADMMEKQTKLRELTETQTKIKINIQNLKNRLEDIKTDINESRRLEEYYDQQIEDFSQRHPDIDREIKQIDDKVSELTKQKNEVQADQRMISIMLEESRKNLSGAHKLGVDECLACGNRSFSRADAEIRVRDLEKKYTNLTKIIGQINIEIDQSQLTIESLQEERQKIKTEFFTKLNDVRQNLKFRENERKKKLNETSLEEKRLKELEVKISDVEKGFDENILSLMHKQGDLRYRIGVNDGEINRIQETITERADVTGNIQRLENKFEFLGQMITYLQNKAKSISDELINAFNTKINEVYQKLDFKDFERIYIDSNSFEVNIIRKTNGNPIRQPITSLSDSERNTIGIISMLAGKEQFLPNFPLFVLDAVTTDYDDTRFNSIIGYLVENVDYVLVTKLSPYETSSELRIKHTF